MNATQIPFLVEGILMSVAFLFGYFLSRKGKPYGKVKLVLHLFFYTWLTVGFGFVSYGLTKEDALRALGLCILAIGLMILIQLITGVTMLFSKKVGKALPRIHVASAILMILADATAFVIAGSHF